MLHPIDFNVPKSLIAQQPAHPRDHAKLLIYDRVKGTIVDDYFYNIVQYLPDPTCVVVNNSKVEHCRLLFENSKKEIFILETLDAHTVRALVRPGKHFHSGAVVELGDGLEATVLAITEGGLRTLSLNTPLKSPHIESARHVPLPPYIAQDDSLAREYQTRYAKTLGSKAAPTAGLHFTNELIKKIQASRQWAEVTLHVGLGTFAPLTEQQLHDQRLHAEWYELTKATADLLNQAAHVTAVGTTSVRVLESAFNGNALQPGSGSTDIFIQPGYEFKRINSLVTNFHLPGTSLLLLVSAFIGSDQKLQEVYEHAIKKQYRFYSFGDAMLVI